MSTNPEVKDLQKAIESNDISNVRELLSKQPGLARGKKRLWRAATLGHHEIVELLVESGANVQDSLEFSKDGCITVTMSILHWMVAKAVPCLEDHKKVGEILIKHGAKVNSCDDKGKTPFQYALLEHKLEWIEFLLENGAVVDEPEKDAASVFSRQKLETRKAVLELLIKHGLDTRVRDQSGRNLLLRFIYYFVRDNDPDAAAVAEVLLDSGLPIDEPDDIGFTALHLAADRQNYKLVSFLVERGADVNAKTASYDTPLNVAVVRGDMEIAELLLSKGADVNAKDSDGRNPVHLACRFHDEDLLEMLILKGGDVSVMDYHGYTPFMDLEDIDDACVQVMVKQLVRLMVEGKMVYVQDRRLMRENTAARKHFERCKVELDKMAGAGFFYEGWSYYSVLEMSSVKELAKLVENEEFVAKYRENLMEYEVYKEDLVRLLEEAIEFGNRLKG